jgi:hypothetical protein
MEQNLKLWESVEQTDPGFTRPMEGSFAGTAINPTYLYKRATEAFGPVGLGWGYDIVSEETIPGSHLGFNTEGKDLGFGQEHVLLLKLWYVLGERRGEVSHYGQTTYLARRGDQILADTDHRKKSITDALSKCLSMLGFAADVFMGRYDDAKYLADLMAKSTRSKSSDGGNQRHTPAVATQASASAPVAGKDQPTGQTPKSRVGSKSPPNADAWIARVGFLGADALANAEEVVKGVLPPEDIDKVLAAIAARRQELSAQALRKAA